MLSVWCVVITTSLVIGVSMAAAAVHPSCDNSREAIVQCASELIDINHDNRLTIGEIEYALSNMVGLPGPNVNVTLFMKCDMDDDGVLTMDDWNHPNSTCLPTYNCLLIACLVCTRNGFVMDFPAATKQRGEVPYDYDAMARSAREDAEKVQEIQKKRQQRMDDIKSGKAFISLSPEQLAAMKAATEAAAKEEARKFEIQ